MHSKIAHNTSAKMQDPRHQVQDNRPNANLLDQMLLHGNMRLQCEDETVTIYKEILKLVSPNVLGAALESLENFDKAAHVRMTMLCLHSRLMAQ